VQTKIYRLSLLRKEFCKIRNSSRVKQAPQAFFLNRLRVSLEWFMDNRCPLNCSKYNISNYNFVFKRIFNFLIPMFLMFYKFLFCRQLEKTSKVILTATTEGKHSSEWRNICMYINFRNSGWFRLAIITHLALAFSFPYRTPSF